MANTKGKKDKDVIEVSSDMTLALKHLASSVISFTTFVSGEIGYSKLKLPQDNLDKLYKSNEGLLDNVKNIYDALNLDSDGLDAIKNENSSRIPDRIPSNPHGKIRR